MRHIRLVPPGLILGVVLASRAAGPLESDPGIDVPVDTDGNGLPDYVRVFDWNGDGLLEMADIQGAIDALTDPGPKTVVVERGDYAPPSQSGGVILELPSNLTLSGYGVGQSVLHGYPGTDLISTGPVISNDAPSTGNVNITIRDLEIDGGWGSGDASSLFHARAGVLFNQCNSCLVENVTVHDTLHACLYSKNGRDVQFRNNSLFRCGNYTGSGATFPCIYLYANAGLTQEDVHVTGNTCMGAGHSGLNTRIDGGTLRNLDFSHNFISDTRIVDGQAAGCIYISEVDGASYTANVSARTGPLWVLASSNILVDDLVLRPTIGSHGVTVEGANNVTLSHLTIDGTGAAGIYVAPWSPASPHDPGAPDLQHLTISDSSLQNVAEVGIALYAGLTWNDVRIERNTIDGTGSAGMLIDTPAVASAGLIVDDNVVADFGRSQPGALFSSGILAFGSLVGLEMRGNTLEDVDRQAGYGIVRDVEPTPSEVTDLCHNAFTGTFTRSNLYSVPGRWDFVTDADGDGSVAACDCNEADATVYPGAPEVNDGRDQECPGDPDYGIMDEISGTSGFHDAGLRDRYSWTAQKKAALYQVLRSASPSLSGACDLTTTSSTYFDDVDRLNPGEARYYVVRPVAPYVGSWGRTSILAPRSPTCAGPPPDSSRSSE